MIFDTHCHLNSPELYSRLEEVVQNAQKIGVQKFLVVGWDVQSSLLAIELSEQYDFIYAAVGIHPTEIDGISEEDLEGFFKLLNKNKVVAVGEIGLDYHWVKDEAQREKQKHYFALQIEYANKYKKPIVIHNRDAFKDCVDVLENNKPLYSGVMHCYSGSSEMLQTIFNLNLLISLGGPVTFTNAKTPKEVAEDIPLEKLLLETDSPYLSPHPLRGTINEPANIGYVLDEVAKLKKISKKHVAEATFNNACKLFGI